MKRERFTVFLVVLLLCACSKNHNHAFDNCEQAIEACREELNHLQRIDRAPINKVVSLTQSWTQLKDSVSNCLQRDTTCSQDIRRRLIILSDSIRDELVRIAGLECRNMQDVVAFKTRTADNDKPKTFEEAKAFFKEMDKALVFPDVRTTIEMYTSLMNGTSINDEKGLKDFLLKEDQCFRSLMVYLKFIPSDTLQKLSQRTEQVFAQLSLMSIDEDVLTTYLTMRINRRVVQNATTCCEVIKSDKKLTEEQRSNYRYMLLQPFMALDGKSMAMLTEEQRNTLNALATELPTLLVILDPSDQDIHSMKEQLNSIARYIIQSHIKTSV